MINDFVLVMGRICERGRNIMTFEQVILTALDNIADDYYKVETTYNPDGIVRERVFCYELYHQMRLLEFNPKYKLHAEIDKSGHNEFDRLDKKNPDFIFHIPGSFDNESVIVEVKGKIDGSNITKDFETLRIFICM